MVGRGYDECGTGIDFLMGTGLFLWRGDNVLGLDSGDRWITWQIYWKKHWVLSFKMVTFILSGLCIKKKKSGIQSRVTHCIHLLCLFNLSLKQLSPYPSLIFPSITLTFLKSPGQFRRMFLNLELSDYLLMSAFLFHVCKLITAFVFETLPTNRFVENVELFFGFWNLFRQKNIFIGINYPVEIFPKIEFHSTQSALSHPLCGLEKGPEKQM